jgi:hypothetical protein
MFLMIINIYVHHGLQTTSFYKASVAKNPKPPSNSRDSWDVVVKFNDDLDEQGRVCARRVPARFVMTKKSVRGDNAGSSADEE